MPFIVYSSCGDNPCSNGGSCRYHAGSHICTCAPQYTGPFCDIEIPTTSTTSTIATTSTTTTTASTEGVNIGAIVGGVIGGVVGVALLVTAIIVVVVVVMRNSRASRRKGDYEERHEMKDEAAHQNIYTST